MTEHTCVQTIVVIIHILLIGFLFQLGVYYKCKVFKNNAWWNFEWRTFQWILCRYFLWLSEQHNVSEVIVLENIVMIHMMWLLGKQKDKRLWWLILILKVNIKHTVLEVHICFYREWAEGNVSWKLEDFTGVSGVTIGCNNPWSVGEIIFGQPKEKPPATGIGFCKNSLVNNELTT